MGRTASLLVVLSLLAAAGPAAARTIRVFDNDALFARNTFDPVVLTTLTTVDPNALADASTVSVPILTALTTFSAPLLTELTTFSPDDLTSALTFPALTEIPPSGPVVMPVGPPNTALPSLTAPAVPAPSRALPALSGAGAVLSLAGTHSGAPLAVIPEPSTGILVATGLFAVARRRRG